ncbi:MAG: acetate uptake transporter [Marmoricola sp.]
MTEEAVQAPSTPSRISLIGLPVPVGVAGFALTTFTLGMYTSGWFNTAGEPIVFVFALFYGGLVQVIAGFFALAKGETFPGTFMTTYGAFWFSFVGLNLYVLPKAGAAESQVLTIFLVMWSVITLIFTVATLGTNKFVFATFVVFDIAIILADIGAAGSLSGVTKASGYGEMVLAAMAWYIVMAEMVNATVGHDFFPMFPFKKPMLQGHGAHS